MTHLERNKLSIEGYCNNKRARYTSIAHSLSVSDNMTRLERKKLSIDGYCHNKLARYTCIARSLRVSDNMTCLACVAGGISCASAFVLVAKPWTRVARPWEDWWRVELNSRLPKLVGFFELRAHQCTQISDWLRALKRQSNVNLYLSSFPREKVCFQIQICK